MLNWGPKGDYSRGLNLVTAILVGGVAGEGVGQVAANISAPYLANAIGDYFAQPGHQNETAQLLSHAVLGAVLAVANGGSAAAGAGAGASGELAAQVISRQLYPDAYDASGNFHSEKLSDDQRQTVIALSTAVGAFVGGVTGGTVVNASVGGSVAQNAAVNNATHITSIDPAALSADPLVVRRSSECRLTGVDNLHASKIFLWVYRNIPIKTHYLRLQLDTVSYR